MHAMEFLLVLKKRWLYVLLPTLLGFGAAAAVSYAATPIYQATASVYFSLPYGESASDLFQGSNYTQKQLSSYATLATLPVVLEPVVEKLNLPVAAADLVRSVDAVASNDTVLIEIRASDSSADEAAAVANAVADQLAVVVRDLSPKGANGQPSVDVSIVAQAIPPSIPSSPNSRRNMAAGLLGGLFLGVLLALTRDRLDTRVRAPKDLPAGITRLATIPFDKAAQKSPLITVGRGRSGRTEVFRSLRTNLQFVDVAQPAQVIVITSSVAGEGKSSTATNLAIVFSEAGKNVLLIDADLRRPRVSEYMGLEGSVGLSNVLVGQAPIEDAVQSWGSDHLSVLASGSLPPNPSELLGSSNMATMLRSLRRNYDLILIDAPPLLPVTDAAVAAVQADGVVLVVRHGKTTRNQLGSAAQSLHAVDARILGVVINMAPPKGSDAGLRYDGYGYYEDDPDKKPSVVESLANNVTKASDSASASLRNGAASPRQAPGLGVTSSVAGTRSRNDSSRRQAPALAQGAKRTDRSRPGLRPPPDAT